MISNQKILRTAVALILVLTTLFSMSSCLFFDYGIYEDWYNQYQDQQNNQNQNPGGKPDGKDDEDNKQEGGNKDDTSTNIPEFYPGSAGGNAENIPALQQTLLSTVMMPPGIPVATVGINGAKNAALLAIQIMAVTDKDLAEKLAQGRAKDTAAVLEADAELRARYQ